MEATCLTISTVSHLQKYAGYFSVVLFIFKEKQHNDMSIAVVSVGQCALDFAVF